MTTLKEQISIFDLGFEDIPVIEVTKKAVKKVKTYVENITIFDEFQRVEQEEKKIAAANVVYPSIEEQLAQFKKELYELKEHEGFSWFKHGLPFSNHYYIRYHRTQPYGINDFDREVTRKKEQVITQFLWELGIEHYRQDSSNLGHKRDKSYLGKEVRSNGTLNEIVQKVKKFTTAEEVDTFFKNHAIFDGIDKYGQADIYYLMPHKLELACLAQTDSEKEILDLLYYSGKRFGMQVYKAERLFFLLEGQTIEDLYYRKLTPKQLQAIQANFERLGRLHNREDHFANEYDLFLEKYNAATKGEGNHEHKNN